MLDELPFVPDSSSLMRECLEALVDGRPNREGQRFDADLRRPGKGRPRRRWVTPRRVETVELLDDRSMLPAIYFIFSRAACDDAAKATLDAGLRLTSDDERRRISQVRLGSVTPAGLRAFELHGARVTNEPVQRRRAFAVHTVRGRGYVLKPGT